jgi:hypothetical protein
MNTNETNTTTEGERIRHVFQLHGGQMTIQELVNACWQHGIFRQDAKRSSMASACRRALGAINPETGTRFAYLIPTTKRT